MATRAVPKKVRLACRRCRSRRIKCDGQTPACSNCAKAGEPCLDVDSQNSHLLIPRNFASAARARIQWLEDIIRTRLPDVDLTSGPQIDGVPDVPRSPEATLREPGEVAGPTATPSPDALTHHRMSLKRPADDAEPFSEKAHSVAMNLGLLSLNSDSSQKAYLGSSSGLLFANLVCASPSSNPSSTIATQDPTDGPAHDLLDRQVSMQSHYRALHYVLRQELPKYEDAALLLQTYIRWIHPEYPILDPASLYGALAALYSCSSYDLNDEPLIPGGWPSGLEPFSWNGKVVQPSHRGSECPPVPVLAFILFMIFNIAAIIKVRSRVYEYSPERYYRLATRFSGDCFSQISLSSVQALTLLIVHCLHTPAEPSFWTLIHVGMAHCVELGLHREPQPGGPDSPTVQQVNRLVFYTLYGLDRSISSIQGRPIGFRDESFDINPPKAEAGPSGITHTPGIPSPITDSFRYTVLRFELDQIVSDIKMRLYLLPSKTAEADAGDAIASQETIHHTLTKWNDRMNAHWSGHAAPSEGRQKYLWGLKLQIRYHTTMILLFQPSQRIPNPSQDSLRIVYNSASVILRSYDLLHKNHALHHGWRSVQNIFAAGAALVYSFWTAELVRSRASPTELSRSLRSCSSLLSVGGEWWPSVKTSLVSFGSVVDLTIQKLYTRSPAAKQARLAMSPSTRDVVPEQGVAAGDNEPGSIPPESSDAPDPATWTHFGHVQQVAGSGTGQPREQWMSPMGEGELQTPTQHWRGGLAYTSTAQEMHSPQERMPEIEDFLADFGRSDFSWSFPLGEIEEALDPDAFLDP